MLQYISRRTENRDAASKLYLSSRRRKTNFNPKWQLEACGKDACAAALLNLFEYWHNIKLEQNSQARGYNEVAQRHGDNNTQIETSLQWHTSEQLENSLLNIFNKRRIQAGIEVLENLKFISFIATQILVMPLIKQSISYFIQM